LNAQTEKPETVSPPTDPFITKLIASSKDKWEQILTENKAVLNQDLIKNLFEIAKNKINKNETKDSIIYLELIDYIEYIRNDKKEYIPSSQCYVALELIKANDMDNALFISDSVLSQNPENYYAHMLMGIVYLRQKVFEKSISEFQTALKIKPNSEDPHYQMAKVYIYSNKLSLAVDELNEVLKINPHNQDAINVLAQLSSGASKKSVRSKNEKANQYFDNAEKLSASQNFKEASDEYKKTIMEDPGFSRAYILLGNCFFHLNELNKAVVFIQKGLDMDPTDALGYFFLGETYEKMFDNTGNVKNIESAIKSYENAINLDPTYENAKTDLKRAKEKRSKVN
jgi:tetratricopeptide (TPR) repeat protein